MSNRLRTLVRRIDRYTLWAFNPSAPLTYRSR
jgi:hypothetical protein